MRTVMVIVCLVALTAGQAFCRTLEDECGTCKGVMDTVRDVRHKIGLQLRNSDVMGRQINRATHANHDDIRRYRWCSQVCPEGSEIRDNILRNLDWIEQAIGRLPYQKPRAAH